MSATFAFGLGMTAALLCVLFGVVTTAWFLERIGVIEPEKESRHDD